MFDFWSPNNLAQIMGGQWLSQPRGDAPQAEPLMPSRPITGLWHDTRKLQPGDAYLALPGTRVDGHTLIPQAAEAGASCAIITQKPTVSHRGSEPPFPCLLVSDPIQALQALAHAFRDHLTQQNTTVIAVSGSNGKTTTRHLIHHVLTTAGLPGSQAPASFNNHLGVPLTLLRAQPTDRFVALELGTNHPGEIQQLAALARPDISVIPSLGEEHLEAFTDLAGVVREEAAVLPHVQPNGVVLTTADAGELLAEHYNVQEGVLVCSVNLEAFPIPDAFALPGEHNQSNAALALALARLFDIPPDTAQRALTTFTPAPHRSHLRRIGPITILDDCYNANPSSMLAALDSFMETEPGIRRVAILGEMLELGDSAERHHRAIAHLAHAAADHVILLGDAFAFDEAHQPFDPDAIAAQLEPGDHVLLKASRGLRLERLLPAIEARFITP